MAQCADTVAELEAEATRLCEDVVVVKKQVSAVAAEPHDQREEKKEKEIKTVRKAIASSISARDSHLIKAEIARQAGAEELRMADEKDHDLDELNTRLRALEESSATLLALESDENCAPTSNGFLVRFMIGNG